MTDGVAVDDSLLGWVREDFGVTLESVRPVGYGADETAELWRAVDADGRVLAVKLSGRTPAGLVLSAYLAERGVPGIAAPLRTRDGDVCAVRDGRRLSVVPWVSDERALGGGMEVAHWRAYGRVLAAVHATEVTEELTRLLPAEDHTHRQVAARVRATDRAVAAVDDATADPFTREAAGRWRPVAGLLAGLLDRADALGAELRGRPVAQVVCHGDPHLGNVLLDVDGGVWLIDWDDAVLAPRERDLMFVRGGVLAFAAITPRQQAAFFEGYGPVEPDPVRLAYHLTVRALDDIADWTRQAMDTGHDDADRVRALDIVRGLVTPVGLVSLARDALVGIGHPPAAAAG